MTYTLFECVGEVKVRMNATYTHSIRIFHTYVAYLMPTNVKEIIRSRNVTLCIRMVDITSECVVFYCIRLCMVAIGHHYGHLWWPWAPPF